MIEEYLEGEEVSFIGLSNGQMIAPAFRRRRITSGSSMAIRGPNTGGMGAYCDARILTPRRRGEIMERIMLPAIAHMRRKGLRSPAFYTPD